MRFRFKKYRPITRSCTSKVNKYISIIILLLLTDLENDDRIYSRFVLDLSSIPRRKLKAKFCFECFEDLVRLKRVLRVPDVIYCENGTRMLGLHALAIVLCRLAYPNRWLDNVDFLGREMSQLSRIYTKTVHFLYASHGYLLESLDQPWRNAERIREFAAAVYRETGIYVKETVDLWRPHTQDKGGIQRLLLEYFFSPHSTVPDNCWGFIDGTAREICRPRVGQVNFYSGNCRLHVVKYQSIVTPDGIIVNIWGPCEGRRHDCYMLNQTQMRARLEEKNREWGTQYCIYGDKGYAISAEIQTPYCGVQDDVFATIINRRMSVVRLAVEYGFGKISQQFAFGSYGKNQRLFWQNVGKQYLVSALLVNCHTCMYRFPLVENRFNVPPPTLEQYLRYPEREQEYINREQ